MAEPTEAGPSAADELYDGISDEERMARAARLEEELRVHPGVVARQRWDELGRAQAIWSRNTRELVALLQALQNEEALKIELIQNVRAPTGRMEIMGQLDQRLHNMLAAATSLVDHTRRHMSAYSSSQFSSQYERRNAAVASAPAAAFLRRLRNYLLHVGNAPFNMRAQFPTGYTEFNTIQLDIRLDPASLLSWDGWNAPAKQYIASFPDGVPLPETVQRYADMMGELYTWVAEQFEVLHGVDIDGANDLVRRLNLTLTSGAWDGRDREKYFAAVQENVRRWRKGEPQIDARTGEEIPEKTLETGGEE